MRKLGFVIANECEEYLVSADCFQNRKVAGCNKWSMLIDRAQVFYTRNMLDVALKHVSSVHKLYSLEIFESDEHFMVKSANGEKPPWFWKSKPASSRHHQEGWKALQLESRPSS